MDFIFKTVDEMSGREMFCLERLRCEVFVTEQGITLPELDDQDLTAIQVLKLNESKTNALATCRIFKDKENNWFLGRVAVARNNRHQNLASDMLEQVHEYLCNKNVDKLFCHAQVSVEPFYKKLGYKTQGEVFDEGGIDHIMMVKKV